MITLRRRPLVYAVAGAILSTFTCQMPSFAAGFEIEEIVVTARQRQESSQDVPLSETVFSARQIEDAGIDQAEDFVQMTPNVTMVKGDASGDSFVTIRGVTQVRNGEPPVATVIDGVLQISPNQFTQELFDVESIEVLRGPQGALYGRNATGGAIIINTKQPTNELLGSVRLGVGRGDEQLLQASISGPIVTDKLFFRMGVRDLERDGYYKNVNLNKEVDPLDDTTFRGMLKWYISERLEADLHVNISRMESGSINFVYQPTVFAADGITLAPGFFPFDFTKVDANDTSTHFTANYIGFSDRDVDEVALKLNYDFDGVSFKSVTSWNHLEGRARVDQFPYTAGRTVTNAFGTVDGTAAQYRDVEAWSQEFRFTSSSDQALRWMAGAYYLRTDRYISSSSGDDLGLGILSVKKSPNPVDSINPTLAFIGDDNQNEAWAVFGQINYDITDQIEFSVALRYDEDKREQKVSAYNTIGLPGAVNKNTFDKLQPKFTLRYEASDSLNFYGSWGEGFRSGQFNQNGVGAAAQAFGLQGVGDSVEQEETETFEIGFKSDWYENRLRVNAALFNTRVQDQHYFLFVAALTAEALVSIGEVELFGAELEVIANLAEGLTVYTSWGYTDSEIKEYELNPNNEGNWAPYVARATFNAGAQYRFEVTENLGIFTRLDYERRGKQFWDPENSSERDALNLLSLRLGIESNTDEWSLVASVNNALDKDFNAEWVSGGFARKGLPRTWALDFKYNF